MRKIFQTQRLETVEGVAQYLGEHGIETKIHNGRSYQGSQRRDFSYSRPELSPQASVWVIKADDYARARQLMREAGLLEQGRTYSSYLPQGAANDPAPARAPDPERKAGRWALRMRLVLLAGIALMAGWMMLALIGG